eukprot:c37982_g1_i1 orf=66-293(+)
MCKIHTLASTAHVGLLCTQVDLLCKQVDLLSTTHFRTDLQRIEMVNLDDNDTGGAMVAQAHCANSANETYFTMTR